MADYIRATGSGGQMMIRDHGHQVEFFIKAGYSTTFANQMPFNWVVDGQAGSSTVRYPSGGNWLLVLSFAIGTSQNVKFGLGNTGTSGLGGPTDFWQYLGRSTVPSAPSGVWFGDITGSQIHCMFAGQSDGGSAILGWEIHYSNNPSGGMWSVASNGSTFIGGLAPGTTYYFWARGRNANGWGSFGPRTQATTATTPGGASVVQGINITQTTMTTQFAGGSSGGMPVLEWNLHYGTNPNYGEISTSSNLNGLSYLTGLLPGTTYYMWVRGRNAVGWGPWSARGSATTPAGAKVLFNGVWRKAVPYVKVNGVWRIAQPYVKAGDIWKITD